MMNHNSNSIYNKRYDIRFREIVANILREYGIVEMGISYSSSGLNGYPDVKFKTIFGDREFSVEVKHVQEEIFSSHVPSGKRKGRLQVNRVAWDSITEYANRNNLERLVVVALEFDDYCEFFVFPNKIIDKKFEKSVCQYAIFSHKLFSDCLKLEDFLKTTYGVRA